MRCHIMLYVFIPLCWALPADNPVRVDLPVYEQPKEPVYDQPKDSSVLLLAQPLEPENHPGDQTRYAKGGFVGSLVSQKVQAATKGQESASHSLAIGPFADPVSTREDALPEIEGWGSKTLSVKENVGNVVAGIFQPKPIVDTIREEEKYGNSGDKFYAAGRAAVGAAQGVSNLVNSVLDIPRTVFKSVARAASEKLNNFGGKLVGLN